MTITGHNNQIGVKPIETKEIKLEVVSGYARIAQKNQLTAMEVVFGDGKINPGDTVYFNGSSVAHAWFKETITLEGQTICVAPVSQVLFVKHGRDTGWNDPLGVG